MHLLSLQVPNTRSAGATESSAQRPRPITSASPTRLAAGNSDLPRTRGRRMSEYALNSRGLRGVQGKAPRARPWRRIRAQGLGASAHTHHFGRKWRTEHSPATPGQSKARHPLLFPGSRREFLEGDAQEGTACRCLAREAPPFAASGLAGKHPPEGSPGETRKRLDAIGFRSRDASEHESKTDGTHPLANGIFEVMLHGLHDIRSVQLKLN